MPRAIISHHPLFEGVPWERWILRDPSKMRVHARLSFIVTTNLPSFVRLIRCFIGRSKPLGRLEEFGQAVFDKEVKIQRSPGTPSNRRQISKSAQIFVSARTLPHVHLRQ